MSFTIHYPSRNTSESSLINFANIYLNDSKCLEEIKSERQDVKRLSKAKFIANLTNCVNKKDKPACVYKSSSRLNFLSMPKRITPKYVKSNENKFQLYGKIKNWEADRKWLELQSKVKTAESFKNSRSMKET